MARGIGPSLTAFGVANALPDPNLELRDNNGALLATNNNWQDDPAQAAELTAASLAPNNNLESGLAITLPPGAARRCWQDSATALALGLSKSTTASPRPSASSSCALHGEFVLSQHDLDRAPDRL